MANRHRLDHRHAFHDQSRHDGVPRVPVFRLLLSGFFPGVRRGRILRRLHPRPCGLHLGSWNCDHSPDFVDTHAREHQGKLLQIGKLLRRGRDKERNDTLSHAWQYWALRTVQLAAVAVPDMDDAIKRQMTYFAKSELDTKGMSFDVAGAAFASLLDYTKKRSEVRDEIAQLDKGIKNRSTVAEHSLESGFWTTFACALSGAPHWGDCRRAVFPEIKHRQMSDGKWIGNWSTAERTLPSVMKSFYAEKRGEDAALRTAVCILMLESEWRYSPPGIM